MNLLAIDTAGPRLQLALLRDGACDVLVEDMAQGQAERIFPAIAELLARNGVTYDTIDRIAVTTGPGSFTGLRIGLSAARGLALALNIPVLGVPTLFAITLGAPGPAAVLLDAKRGQSYVLVPGAEPDLLPTPLAQAKIPTGMAVITDPQVPIGLLAQFAVSADPAAFPPNAAYIRGADAKPQEKFRIARR